MTLLATLKTNWRDIIVGVALVLGISFAADVVEKLSVTQSGVVWLANVTAVLKGLARFAAANLAAWFMLAVAWPTLNRYSNASFQSGWDSLDRPQRFFVLIAVSVSLLLSASISFL